MNLATGLTLLRILLLPFILCLLLWKPENYLAAGLLFLAAAATDWVDGFLARRLNQASRMGEFLDPLADKVLVLGVMLALVEKGMVSSVPVIIILMRELGVMGLRIMAANKNLSLPAEKPAKLKTALQVAAVLWLMWNLPLAGALLWSAVLLSLISGANYLWILKA